MPECSSNCKHPTTESGPFRPQLLALHPHGRLWGWLSPPIPHADTWGGSRALGPLPLSHFPELLQDTCILAAEKNLVETMPIRRVEVVEQQVWSHQGYVDNPNRRFAKSRTCLRNSTRNFHHDWKRRGVWAAQKVYQISVDISFVLACCSQPSHRLQTWVHPRRADANRR